MKPRVADTESARVVTQGTLWERVRIRPRFESDEKVLGVTVALVLHGLFAFVLIDHPRSPAAQTSEIVPIRPVVEATLLKLGRPVDPKKLPDRLVPQLRTAPHPVAGAASDQGSGPRHPSSDGQSLDAGAPPPNTLDDPLQNLIARSDAFGERGKARPEIGDPNGVREGTETDPSKVRAGDMYAAKMAQFFRDRWDIPTVISEAQASRLCVSISVTFGSSMQITHVGEPLPHGDPHAVGRITKSSGNQLFDESARAMLEKLQTSGERLPDPPAEVAPTYRGRRVILVLSGDLHGDASRCR